MTSSPYSDSLSLGLRISVLNPPFPISRRLILQQARGQVLFPPTACQHTVSCSISLPLRGFSFNFPSLYYFAIGHLRVFSLTRWSSQIHTGFHVPHATRDKTGLFSLSTTGLSPSMVQDSAASSRIPFTRNDAGQSPRRVSPRVVMILKLFSHYPHPEDGFRLFPFRSPLLWESLLLSFPSATKMFQFAELPLTHL